MSDKLPARVQAAIARQQYQSELVVGVAQLVIVALLSVLYVVAPAGYAPDAPVRAAPLGLSLFGILVLVRLYFAYTRQLKSWFIGFSCVAEMAVLIGAIWAYHLEFEHQATIVLKNSAFLYIFILIALRSLRFEPQWAVISGLTAAVCWSAVLAYALKTSSGNPLTWDYVTYATTGRIHLGGEFDKILAILLVTGIMTLSLIRARRLLVKAATQGQAASDLSHFFDDAVAQQITGADTSAVAGQGELRQAAVLFTDMRGFTHASASMTPADLIALLGEYQRLVVPLIQQFGGSIDKFMGDGILASFGAVKTSTTYAADGVKAVDAIMQAAAEWQRRRQQAGLIAPGVGAGLASGEVVFGIIGDDKRLEYTVIGDTVNLAAKLEKQNKPEHSNALTTKDTLDKARAQGYDGKDKDIRLQRTVGGVKEPVDLAAWV